MTSSRRIYLDYAATTPVDPAVLRAMMPFFSEAFGNAGSLHSFGQEAIAALDGAREILAAAIGADFREIIFTGSATEANNLALRGVVDAWRNANGASRTPRILVSAVEHESVLETARCLGLEGADIIYLPVSRVGVVDPDDVARNLSENTAIVSVMTANNEIGTIQPTKKIAEAIGDFKKSYSGGGNSPWPVFHTDASPAFQFLDCGHDTLGADLVTFSSHKIYGPKGAGALFVKNSKLRRRMSLSPLFMGGGQEFGLRSGTENIPAIIGFAKAVELSADSREATNLQILGLRDELWRGIKRMVPRAAQNGAAGHLPNILNVYFPGNDAEELLTRLDLMGVAASSGSACRARSHQSSHVIEALGYSSARARSSIRFSLGRPTTKNEIARTIVAIKKIVASRG
jgi:cysteine desulfurase